MKKMRTRKEEKEDMEKEKKGVEKHQQQQRWKKRRMGRTHVLDSLQKSEWKTSIQGSERRHLWIGSGTG